MSRAPYGRAGRRAPGFERLQRHPGRLWARCDRGGRHHGGRRQLDNGSPGRRTRGTRFLYHRRRNRLRGHANCRRRGHRQRRDGQRRRPAIAPGGRDRVRHAAERPGCGGRLGRCHRHRHDREWRRADRLRVRQYHRVDAGGQQIVENGGTADATTVNAGGMLVAYGGADIAGETIKAGATLLALSPAPA